MSKFDHPNDLHTQKDNKKGIVSSIVLHLVILAGIVVGVFDKSNTAAGPLQLELWTEGTEQIIAPPSETQAPEPAEEDARTQKEDPITPEPEPEPESESESEPNPPSTQKASEPPPKATPPESVSQTARQEDPDIALEKKRQQAQAKAAQEKAAAQAKALADKQAKAAREKAAAQEKAAQEKAAQEKAAQEKAAQEKAAQEKAAQEKAAKEKAAQEKAAAQAKARQDARLAAQAKAQAKAANDARLAALRSDILNQAGIKNGQNDRNQIGGGGGNNAYARLVKACVEPRLRFSGHQRLTVRYKVEFDNARKVTHARITRTSGNKAFDAAALNALKQCNPFPKPPNGNNYVEGNYEFRPR